MDGPQKRVLEAAPSTEPGIVPPSAPFVKLFPGARNKLNRYSPLPFQSYLSVFAFETFVGDDLRTCGVVVHRPANWAANLDDLDLERLVCAAAGRDGASARGKVVLVGLDGAMVLQTSPFASPEPAVCGNGIAAVARLPGLSHRPIKVFGPAGKVFEVALTPRGLSVAQTWTMALPTCSEDSWLGRRVLRLDVLNPYAILEGPLPAGVTPEQARQALVGETLSAKLAVVQRSPTGAFVSFFNAGGAHGAAPLTGLVTLAIAARRSPWAADVFADGKLSYRTKAGVVSEQLLAVVGQADGAISVAMPEVIVRLTRLDTEWSK